MRLVGRGNFHLKIVYTIFLSELNCHFQNYRCPGHFFRITSGEFVNEHIKIIMKYVKKGKKLVLKTKHRKHPPKHQWNWEKCSKSTFHLPEIITLASIGIKISFNQNLLSQTICTTVVVSDWCITNLAYCWWFSIQSIVGIERRRN